MLELGMRNHADKPEFVLAYVDFLYYMGDDAGVRTVLKRGLEEVPADKTAVLWDRFLQFESLHGDLGKVCGWEWEEE